MSASPPRLPGAAEPTWLARPTRSPEQSLPNLPTSSPQSPGGTSPTAASLGARSPGRLARRLPASRTPADRCPIRRLADHPSLRSRFRLVNPVGPSRPVVAAVVAHRGSPRTSRPFLGLRLKPVLLVRETRWHETLQLSALFCDVMPSIVRRTNTANQPQT